jgi:hypothetical protein
MGETIMVDFRVQKERRKEEGWFDKTCAVLIFVATISTFSYVGFMGGRWYDIRETAPIIKELRAEVENLKSKILQTKYGPKYYYFTTNGISYYVKDTKDLEEKKKWIRVK